MGWWPFGSKSAAAPAASAPAPETPVAAAAASPAASQPPPQQGEGHVPAPRVITRTGTRAINAAELDSANINVIAAKRVDSRTLLYTGDTIEVRDQKKHDAETGADKIVYGKDSKRCNTCCMMIGAGMSTGLSMFLSMGQTAFFAYREQHRINITVAKFCRHAAWMLIPPTLVGTTLHWFLAESFWSKRRNTFGMAWAKAVAMNTALWGTMIGLGTLTWRKGMRLTTYGNKLYYRYPAAGEGLELRLIENPHAIWTGMTWSYWALGLIGGQAGYLACASVVVAQNRVHTLMSPVGTYAAACAPWWRREQIAMNAGMELRRESDRPKPAAGESATL